MGISMTKTALAEKPAARVKARHFKPALLTLFGHDPGNHDALDG